MDGRATAVEPKHSYPSSTPASSWAAAAAAASPSSASIASHAPASLKPAAAVVAANSVNNNALAAATVASHPLATPLDFLPLPFLLPQTSVYQAQLEHYNQLVSPYRGGGVQTPPLGPVLSAPHIQAAPRTRSRSSSKVSNKEHALSNKGSSQGGGHGNSRTASNTDKGDRAAIVGKEASSSSATSKMAPRQQHQQREAREQREQREQLPVPPQAPREHQQAQMEPPHPIPARPPPPSHGPSHSSSVPSTPHQHARNFSFESREPSPNATGNHSPRSAYSETNSTLPSLRPLPPRNGGCQYETAQQNSRRRIPYSMGIERLERSDLSKIPKQLSKEAETKLTIELDKLYDTLLPTEQVEENRKRLVAKLERIFNDEWPDHSIRVHLFGSSGNLLCSDDSDVDICIATSWKDMANVCMIAELLARQGMEKVVCISAAKVPIVKIYDPELKLACDINVNNTTALENTRMIRTYVEIDPRVRSLAMIVKYWTRRRIINDAGLGGTLSSYTWICMVIAFLQLRDPPILPALHQHVHDSLPKKKEESNLFGDDLSKLREFVKDKTSTLGALLFQFFRFYAHEFNYDKFALSIRTGRQLTKVEKNWARGHNNALCCEEPFTTTRNLGNTADDTSFRGIHLELRRAFDLLVDGKLEECCEKFVFPKEEERSFSRPPQQPPRPILLRSASQQHNGRGRGGFRGNRHSNFNRTHRADRRASSSATAAYDPNAGFLPAMSMGPPDLPWYSSQVSMPYPGDLMMGTMASALAADPNALALRVQMYNTQMYTAQQHVQAMAQAQARMPSSGGGLQQHQSQTPERSRTNSFDTAPLSAPLQPDLYSFYLPMQAQYYAQPAGIGTLPSSPATVSGAASEGFRRSLQRAAVASESGSPGSSLRSQSQPASSLRSGQAVPQGPGYGMGVPGANAFPSVTSNGVPIPSFIPPDADYDEIPQRSAAESPPSEEDWSNFDVKTSSPSRKPQVPPGVIAFGDLNESSQAARRRLSTDQRPQSILDRRMRRQSRSPSPLGHARAFSVGTSPSSSAPLMQTPFTPTTSSILGRPLIVNGTGSGLKTSMTPSQRQPSAQSATESIASDDSSYSAVEPTYPRTQGLGLGLSYPAFEPMSFQPGPASEPLPPQDRPIIVNGTSAATPPSNQEDASFRDRIARLKQPTQSFPLMPETPASASSRLSPSNRRQATRPPVSGVIAPLDLATTEFRFGDHPLTDLQHLSPVYETRTPSPTAVRKFDPPMKTDKATMSTPSREPRGESSKGGREDGDGKAAAGRVEPTKARAQSQPRQGSLTSTQGGPSKHTSPIPSSTPSFSQNGPTVPSKLNGVRENGHVRGAKSESHNEGGGWQKAGKRGKKGGEGKGQANGHANAENLPRHEAERKGG